MQIFNKRNFSQTRQLFEVEPRKRWKICSEIEINNFIKLEENENLLCYQYKETSLHQTVVVSNFTFVFLSNTKVHLYTRY